MKRIISFIVIISFAFSSFSQDGDSNASKKSGSAEYHALIEKGEQLDSEEEFREAINVFSEAIDLEPDNALGYDKRAISYIKLKKYRKADKDLTKAIELDPEYAEAYNHRGLLNYFSNKAILAMPDFNKAIKLDPDYAQPFFNRGILKYDFGNVEEAYIDFKQAYKLGYEEGKDAFWEYLSDRIFVIPDSLKTD